MDGTFSTANGVLIAISLLLFIIVAAVVQGRTRNGNRHRSLWPTSDLLAQAQWAWRKRGRMI